MTLKTCSCAGSNENCFRCAGLGTYELQPSSFVPRRPRRGAASRSRAIPARSKNRSPIQGAVDANPMKCPRCIFRGSAEEMKRHSEKFHLDEFWRRAARPTVRCPKCSVTIRASKLNKHLRKVHSEGNVARAADAPAAGILVRCPKCPNKVRSVNLEKHLRRVHDIGWAAYANGAASEKTKAVRGKSTIPKKRLYSSTEGSSSATPSNQLERDDLRDAHRTMGFVARESGRFGSHPLHDRFDDESSA